MGNCKAFRIHNENGEIRARFDLLDMDQIGSGLQHVSGPAVAQQMNGTGFGDAGLTFGFDKRVRGAIAGDRAIGKLTGEQPRGRSRPTPIGPQFV